MLLYRAWCETRVRFAIAAAALLAIAVTSARGEGPQTIFLLLAITLGGGSLRQEQLLGTAGFTLALPVTRTRLLAARAVVGALEVVALAIVVASSVRAPELAVRWGACGVAVVAASLCCAAVFASEYTAWLAAFLLIMAYEAAANFTALPVIDLYVMMQPGAVPWGAVAGFVAASIAALALANLHLQRRDF